MRYPAKLMLTAAPDSAHAFHIVGREHNFLSLSHNLTRAILAGDRFCE
jgi:hypothetical protein